MKADYAKERLLITALFACVILLWVQLTFSHVEQREGFLIADVLLQHLPVKDVSWAIFAFLYVMLLSLVVRFRHDRDYLLFCVQFFLVLNALRMLSLWCVPLAPPHDLMPMSDPFVTLLLNRESSLMTRDLFFSGHVSHFVACAFLHYKYANRLLTERERRLFISTMSVLTTILALLLLVQHIHYTVDIIAAIPAVFIAYQLTKLHEKMLWTFLEKRQRKQIK